LPRAPSNLSLRLVAAHGKRRILGYNVHVHKRTTIRKYIFVACASLLVVDLDTLFKSDRRVGRNMERSVVKSRAKQKITSIFRGTIWKKELAWP